MGAPARIIAGNHNPISCFSSKFLPLSEVRIFLRIFQGVFRESGDNSLGVQRNPVGRATIDCVFCHDRLCRRLRSIVAYCHHRLLVDRWEIEPLAALIELVDTAPLTLSRLPHEMSTFDGRLDFLYCVPSMNGGVLCNCPIARESRSGFAIDV